MRHWCLIKLVMIIGLSFSALAVSTLFAAPAVADTIPECLDSKTTGNETNAQAWWDRRSAEEQSYMRDLPCEKRYIVAVCIFLYDPDIKACTNKGVARFDAARHCAAQGHEILSQADATCQADYVARAKPRF